MPEKPTEEQMNHIKAKVKEFLPEFISRLNGSYKFYALSYAMELLALELKPLAEAQADHDARERFQALSDYLDYSSQPKPPKGERQQLKESLRSMHKKKPGCY